MIISLAIEHTDLMSNIEQGMSNYEVLFCLSLLARLEGYPVCYFFQRAKVLQIYNFYNYSR